MNEEKEEERQDKNEKVVKELAEWGKSILAAFLLAAFLMNFVLFFAKVPSSSMVPTIAEGQKILVYKFYRYFDWEHRGLEYGDIVVFKHEKDGKEELFVKRVIGMPLDEIEIIDGFVYRNGEKLVEDYIPLVNRDFVTMHKIYVPENEFFVLGDNRKDSYDSRFWEYKTIPFEKVVGEVKLK